jgi:peptide subunit release factor 1 (eRF1)
MQTPIEIINQLSEATSETNGTSLITLYVPYNYQLSVINTLLNNELSSCHNIKDKTVKSAVQKALKNSIQKINQIEEFPENGFVLCAGNLNEYL